MEGGRKVGRETRAGSTVKCKVARLAVQALEFLCKARCPHREERREHEDETEMEMNED